MNCVPGDLAVVISAIPGMDLTGRIVRCIRLAWEYEDAMWEVENPPYIGGIELLFDDDLLRPIRDPGEDAKDETLTWLPVPTLEVA